MNKHTVRLLSTFFGLGYFPLAAGSIASMTGAVLYILLQQYRISFIIIFFIVAEVGYIVSEKMEGIVKEKDPSCIVIDEVAGSMIAFFMLPIQPAVFITAFFLFRAFDMFKIYPANRLQNISGGMGVMSDDIVAGAYTNITMHIAIRLAGII